jgi:hypothetical protein
MGCAWCTQELQQRVQSERKEEESEEEEKQADDDDADGNELSLSFLGRRHKIIVVHPSSSYHPQMRKGCSKFVPV